MGNVLMTYNALFKKDISSCSVSEATLEDVL